MAVSLLAVMTKQLPILLKMVYVLLLVLFFVCFVMSVQATGIFEFFSTDITLIISRELNTEITHIISNSNLLFFKEALQTNVIRFFNDDFIRRSKDGH